jgi:hypothetical protein
MSNILGKFSYYSPRRYTFTVIHIIREMNDKNCQHSEACRRIILLKMQTSTDRQADVAGDYTRSRCLYFLIGTFPSVVKLVSFPGILWTKTWGLMFISSFIINEAIAFPARSSTCSLHEDAAQLPPPASIVLDYFQRENQSQDITEAFHNSRVPEQQNGSLNLNHHLAFIQPQNQRDNDEISMPLGLADWLVLTNPILTHFLLLAICVPAKLTGRSFYFNLTWPLSYRFHRRCRCLLINYHLGTRNRIDLYHWDIDHEDDNRGLFMGFLVFVGCHDAVVNGSNEGPWIR